MNPVTSDCISGQAASQDMAVRAKKCNKEIMEKAMADKTACDLPNKGTVETDPALVRRIENILSRYDGAGWHMPVDIIAREIAEEISADAPPSELQKSA